MFSAKFFLTKFAVKKLIIVCLMTFALLNFLGMTKRGFYFFPLTKTFSTELFLAHRLEPVTMLEAVFKEVITDTENRWADYGLKIQLVRNSKKDSWADSESDPLITLFFEKKQLNDLEINKVVDFRISSKLTSLIYELGHFRSEEIVEEANESWRRDVESASMYTPEEYEKLRKEFPQLTYSFEEISVLRATGMALHMIHSLSHIVTKGECIYGRLYRVADKFKLSSDRIFNLSFKPYAKYFCDNNKQLCLVASLWHKGKLILIAFLLNLLCFHLVRPSLNSILSEQARRERLNISLAYRWRMMIFFWQAVIFTDRRSNLLMIAKYICEDYKQYLEDRVKKILAEKAGAVQVGLVKELGQEEFEKDRYLKILLEMAQGLKGKENKPLAYRENALKLLKATLEKLRAKSQPIVSVTKTKSANPLTPVSKKPRAEKEKVERRERFLTELKNLLPKTVSLDFARWKNSELDNLRSALILLKVMGQDFVPLLLAKPNFNDLIKDSHSTFMSAVRGDRREEVAKMLEENEDEDRLSAMPKSAEELSLPSDLEVIVISGDKLIGRKAEIIAALKALGPKSVEFLDVTKFGKASDVVRSDTTNKLVVLTFIPHGFLYKIRTNKKLVSILVDVISPEKFAREVAKKAKKFYKTV